jgi:hypothetical protein
MRRERDVGTRGNKHAWRRVGDPRPGEYARAEIFSDLARARVALLCAPEMAPAAAETLAPTKAIEGKDLHVTDMRNMPLCEIEVVAGFPRYRPYPRGHRYVHRGSNPPAPPRSPRERQRFPRFQDRATP